MGVKSAEHCGETGLLVIGLTSRSGRPHLRELRVKGSKADLKKLNEMVLGVSPRAGTSFLWSSFQILSNVSSKLPSAHVSETLLMVTGDFSGGGFIGEGKQPLDLKDKAVFCEPQIPHRVEHHEEDSILVIAFLHPNVTDVKASLRKDLFDLGFKLSGEDRPEIVPAIRVLFSKEMLLEEDVVYVGRGHAGFGAEASTWGNNFEVSKNNTRKKVIKAFRQFLSRAPALLENLESLNGKRLACHCPLALPCHGDVIIEFFKDRFCTPCDTPPEDEAIHRERD